MDSLIFCASAVVPSFLPSSHIPIEIQKDTKSCWKTNCLDKDKQCDVPLLKIALFQKQNSLLMSYIQIHAQNRLEITFTTGSIAIYSVTQKSNVITESKI